MIKELEELKIKRLIAAKACNLTMNEGGTRYLKLVEDDESCPRRFYCNINDWKPDEDWNHFMFARNRIVPGNTNVVLVEDFPKGSFDLLMLYIA